MTSCEALYKEWEKKGNFCNKSEFTAKQIEEYIEYRKRNRLKDIEINRCALYPMIRIEHHGMLHDACLKELKKTVKRMGVKSITRRYVIEIINKINKTIPITERIDNIPDVRNRMSGLQHTIEHVSYETKEAFDHLKVETGFRGNEELMNLIFSFCNDRKNELVEYRKDIGKIQLVKES